MSARALDATRVVVGAGAAGLALLVGGLFSAGFLLAGYPFTAAASIVALAPLLAFLVMLAAAPAPLQRLLSRRTRLDLSEGGHLAAAILIAFTFYLVFGLGALASGAHALEAIAQGRGSEVLAGGVEGGALAAALVQNLILFVVPVVLYVSLVYKQGPADVLRTLGLRSEGAGVSILLGFGVAFLALVAIAVASLVLALTGLSLPENERALAIARSVTIPGVLAIAVVSSLSEEIFFRGFLQPRIGLVAQAAVFSLSHLSYGNVLEIVVTFLLALAFGFMYRRTGNLWAPIAAHFLFNLLMLLAGTFAEPLGSTENETLPG